MSADKLNWPEGHHPGPLRGKVALSRSPRQSVQQQAECPCGEWDWREVTLQTGLAAVERYCPRCRRRMLLVFRGPNYLGAIAFGGAHERPIEVALSGFVSEEESCELMRVARLVAS